jgi:nitroreductase
MDLREAIYGRRAIRDFTSKSPSVGLLAELIIDAVQAPNSINRQAWAFTVAQGRDQLARYSREAKGLALSALDEHVSPELRSHLEAPDFDIFYNAPALIVICATQPDAMAQQDCCLAAQNLMLSAYAHGLGSCWIGFASAWLGTPAAREELGIPDGHIPVAPIIVGYPKMDPPPGGRRTPTITWVS